MVLGRFFEAGRKEEMDKPRENEKLIDQVEEEYAALVTYEMSVKKWDELEALEHDGKTLFPDVLHERKGREFSQVRVAFLVPKQPELRKARRQAREIFAEEGLDEEKDRAQFSDLEDACILWLALRSPTAPYEPFEVDPRALEARFDRDVLKLAWAKLEGYRRVLDPRPAAITREQVIAAVAAIAKRRDISPLHVFDGPAQNACVVFMACLLQSFMTLQSSQPSSESSTPEA
jgi:hypothetical protein